jgi:uncharacterized membrane protein YphA (DoxX/SURF4 family)
VRRRDETIRGDPPATRVAWISGAVFIPAGLVKFVWHAWELRAFVRFGLPVPNAWVIAAGVLEITAGRFVVGAALAMAVTMAVAIAVSGIAQGDVIPSLTLAPALLIAMVFLLARSG